MKLIKKIGIGCLALIICFCSCFKFVNAYSFENFDYSLTQPGSNRMQPLINCNLSFVTTSASGTTYLMYPLTSLNYVGSNVSTIENNVYYDTELNKQYSFSISSDIQTYDLLRIINDAPKEVVYTYQTGDTHYYNISESGVDYIVIDFDYNMLYHRDIPYAETRLFFPTNSNIIGNYSLEYYMEYFDNDRLLSNTQTFNYQLDTSSSEYLMNSINVSYWPSLDTQDDYFQFLNNVQPIRMRVKITSNNIDFSLIDRLYFDTAYVNIINYANIFNLASQTSTIVIEPPTDDGIDFTSWLTNSVRSFMNFEIFPNFKLGNILGVIVSIPLLIYILKLFLGG